MIEFVKDFLKALFRVITTLPLVIIVFFYFAISDLLGYDDDY